MLQTGKKTLRRSTAAAAWLVTMIGCSLLVESTLDGKGGDDACGGACGIGTLCVDGACELSVCGDGVIDPQTEEQCEDGNDVSGDGCEPTTCRFSCQEDANCANEEDPCSGSGVCRPLAEGTTVTGKLCEVTLAAAGTTCAFDEADDGLCKNGLCAPATCGNGEVDDGEDCDDSQDGDNGDGCRDDCAFTCAGDDDCDDGNGCNGTETCTAAHVCTPPKAESCMDDENCTMNLCVDGSCVYEIVDNDSDGFPDIECKDEDRYGEWDCDGMRGDVYPGAPEQCDEVSHDCDSKVDEDTDDLSCFQDLDGDSFGDPDERKIADCSCPAGYVVNKLDCHDVGNQAKSVNPDYPTGEYSAIPYCKKGSGTAGCTELSFDFDCDGKETPVSTKLAGNCTSASPGSCEQFSGWLANVPECGEEGRRVLCNEPSGADTIKSCQPQFLEQKQRCR